LPRAPFGSQSGQPLGGRPKKVPVVCVHARVGTLDCAPSGSSKCQETLASPIPSLHVFPLCSTILLSVRYRTTKPECSELVSAEAARWLMIRYKQGRHFFFMLSTLFYPQKSTPLKAKPLHHNGSQSGNPPGFWPCCA